MESCNTESSLDLPLESLSLQPFLQSLHKEQWQEVRLGDITSIIGDGLHGTPNFDVNGECFFINGNNLNDGQIIIKKDTKKVSSIECAKYKKDINEKTILISINGTLGNMALYRGENIMLGKSACYLNFKDNVSRNFMRYVIINNDFQRYLNISATGTTILNVSLKAIRDFTFLLPPLTIQQKIAEILSSFDDKIDLLHRQNKTLESLALTLFRHYFIDNPKRDEWELGKLGDYVKIIDNRGKTPPFTTDITPYPLIEVNALSDDSMLINYDIVRKYVIKETYQKWFREHIKQYDILFSTVGSIGEVAMLLDNKGCIAQNVIGFRARDISPFYLYEWLKYMQQEIKEFDIGSVQPSIKVTHFVEKQIYKPDSKILESFDKQMLLITDKISHNAKQIQNLQAMRDLMLRRMFN